MTIPPAALIYAVIKATPGLGKAAILVAAVVAETDWPSAIKELQTKGRVRQEGVKRGAKYYPT